MCVVCAYMPVPMHVPTQRPEEGVRWSALTLPYSFDIGFLTELGQQAPAILLFLPLSAVRLEVHTQ